jgi:hypothetical protein
MTLQHPDGFRPPGEPKEGDCDPAADAPDEPNHVTGENEPNSPLDGRLARWPLFPYLLCCFTVVSFLVPNIGVVSPPQVLTFLLSILGVCLAVHVALHYASQRRTALISLGLLGMVITFFYEPVMRQVILQLPGSSWRLPLGPLSMSLGKFLTLGVCAALPLAGGAFGWFLRPRSWNLTCLCLNLLLLGLLLSSTVSLATGWYQSLSSAASVSAKASFTVQEPNGIEPELYPDIIHIVLDEVPSGVIYSQITGEEALPMTETMRRWGGQVASHSSANMNFTVFSTFSLLNFHLPKTPPTSRGSGYRDAAALRQLRHLGYRIEAHHWAMPIFGPWWNRNEFGRLAIVKFWQKRTIWGTIRAIGKRWQRTATSSSGALTRQQFEKSVQGISAVRAASTQPVYYFAHVVGAHRPHVYDSEGNHLHPRDDDDDELAARSTKEKLQDAIASAQRSTAQLKYCWRQFEEAVDTIMASKRKRPLVIIVQSDHGFRWNEEWETLVTHRGLSSQPLYSRLPYELKYPAWPAGFSNYIAVFASPPLRFSVPDTVTVVNIFPNLFNQVFGMDIPMRQDRHYTGGRIENDPWVDCTDEVRELLLPDVLPER